MQEIILASNNRKKIVELRQILAPLQLNLLPQAQFFAQEADESATTFIENALIKARHASKLSTLPAIADDSGLVVPALNGAPGIYSARYAGEHGNDQANNAKLLRAMAEQTDRRAYFVCVIVYLRHPQDPLPLIAQGIWHGHIAHQPQGENGFGYDPIFWLDSHQQTAAQLADNEKNRLSHRAQALASLKHQLQAFTSAKI